MKTCSRCKQSKSLDQFNVMGDRHQSYCRSCQSIVDRGWRADNPGRKKDTNWARDLNLKYGTTVEEYKSVLASQDGVCLICKELDPVPGRRLAVDHRAGLGKRALLCSRCNIGLGQFRHDPGLLRRAALYVEVHRG